MLSYGISWRKTNESGLNFMFFVSMHFIIATSFLNWKVKFFLSVRRMYVRGCVLNGPGQ